MGKRSFGRCSHPISSAGPSIPVSAAARGCCRPRHRPNVNTELMEDQLDVNFDRSIPLQHAIALLSRLSISTLAGMLESDSRSCVFYSLACRRMSASSLFALRVAWEITAHSPVGGNDCKTKVLRNKRHRTFLSVVAVGARQRATAFEYQVNHGNR